MSSRGTLWLAIIAIVAVAAAIFVSRPSQPKHAAELGAPLYPQLKTQLNDVTAIHIRGTGSSAVTIDRKENGWHVAERGGFAADPARVRKLLLALGDAKLLEQKSERPENYAALGVEDLKSTAATGKLVELTGTAQPVSLIVGKQPDGRSTYVRRSGEVQSWQVDTAIDASAEPKTWLLTGLVDIKPERVQSAEIAVVGKPAWSIAKTTDKDAEYKVSGVPHGRELTSPLAPSDVANALNGLHLDDVRAVPQGSTAAPAAAATLRTFDGLAIRCTGYVEGESHYLRIESSTTSTDEAKKKEAADLDARARGFEFEIPSYKYSELFKPIEDLLTKPVPPQKGAQQKSRLKPEVPQQSPATPPAVPQN